jgi:alkylhydroperoxidase family enzyme
MSKARVGSPSTKTGHIVRDSSLGLAPATLDAILPLNDLIWRRNSIRHALLEMLRLRNARTVNCVFCKSVRYDVARADGLTEEKVSRITDEFADSDLLDIEKLVLEFADVYLFNPDDFSPRLIRELQRHFSKQQICHLAISIASFNAMSKCAVSLGGMPDSLPVMEIPLPPSAL